MKSETVESIIDDAVYKVVWKDYTSKIENIKDYCPGTMLDPEWDALEMFQYELMALKMRNQYGFEFPTNQS